MTLNEYKKLISAVRKRLDDGVDRIYQEPDNYSAFWWPDSIGFADHVESLVGLTTDEEIRREFEEEVDVIQQVYSEMQSATVTRIDAMGLWSVIAAPIRLKRGVIYRRWLPQELGAGPIVKEMPVETFHYYMVDQWLKLSEEKAKLQRSRNRWAAAALVASTIILLPYLKTIYGQ